MRYLQLSNTRRTCLLRAAHTRQTCRILTSSVPYFTRTRSALPTGADFSVAKDNFSTAPRSGLALLEGRQPPVVGYTRGAKKAWNVDASGKPLFDETSAPPSADVVVVGGGSLGCSALYHLAKLGVTFAVLVEANKLTAGTTWHTAGLVWDLRPSDTETLILNRTLQVLKGLEEETGVNPGWINNGGVLLASTKVDVLQSRCRDAFDVLSKI